MYIEKERGVLRNPEIVSMEDLVSANHLVRKLERAIDWNWIREEVRDLFKKTILNRRF